MLNFWPFNRRQDLPSKKVDIPLERVDYTSPNGSKYRFVGMTDDEVTRAVDELEVYEEKFANYSSLPHRKKEYIDSRGVINTFYNVTDKQFEEAAKRVEEDIANNPNQTVKDVLDKDDVYGIESRPKTTAVEECVEPEQQTDDEPKLVDAAGRAYRSGDRAYYFVNHSSGTLYHSAKDGWHLIREDGGLVSNIVPKWLYPVASWQRASAVKTDLMTEAVTMAEAERLSEVTGAPLRNLVDAINRRPEQTQKLSIDEAADIEDQLLSPDPEFQKFPRGVQYMKDRNKYRAHIKVGDKRRSCEFDTLPEAIACRKGMELLGKKKGGKR